MLATLRGQSGQPYLDEEELEWDTVNSTGIILEVEHVDEVAVFSCKFFFRNTFSEDLSVFVEVQDRVLSRRFPIKPVGAHFINADLSTLLFIRNLSLRNERLNNIFDCSRLGYQKIKGFLNDSQLNVS
jgi:hypothetical protein